MKVEAMQLSRPRVGRRRIQLSVMLNLGWRRRARSQGKVGQLLGGLVSFQIQQLDLLWILALALADLFWKSHAFLVLATAAQKHRQPYGLALALALLGHLERRHTHILLVVFVITARGHVGVLKQYSLAVKSSNVIWIDGCERCAIHLGSDEIERR